MKEIKWGIIGCGDVTEKKSGPAFNKVQHSSLVAVMRRDADKAKDYAARHHVPKWYNHAGELIHDAEVNAIYIATPPQSHCGYAIQAMKAGKPVYVEKPMAVNYKDCTRMNSTAKDTGMPLFVAYYRRSLPYFKKVQQIIEEGKIGNVISIDIEYLTQPRPQDPDKKNLPWRVISDLSGGGYFYDMACHQLDLLDMYFGQITDVYGTFSNRMGLYDVEDTVSASFRFGNGVIGSGLWSFVTHEKFHTDIMKITGDKGIVEFSAFDFTPVILKTVEEETEILPENPENIQYCLIKDVVDELLGRGKSPSTGISGARTNKVMDTILQKI